MNLRREIDETLGSELVTLYRNRVGKIEDRDKLSTEIESFNDKLCRVLTTVINKKVSNSNITIKILDNNISVVYRVEHKKKSKEYNFIKIFDSSSKVFLSKESISEFLIDVATFSRYMRMKYKNNNTFRSLGNHQCITSINTRTKYFI